MAFDPTGRPLEQKVERVKTAETEEEKQEEVVHEYADQRLKQLSSNDEMYDTLEFFLLGDPERQIEQLEDVEGLLKAGDEAKAQLDLIMARYSYEIATKIEMYRQNKDDLWKCLLLAREVTEDSDRRSRLQRTIFDRIDEALRIACEYYRQTAAERKENWQRRI